MGIQWVSANGSGSNGGDTHFDEQLPTEETLVHILRVNSLVLP